MNPIPLFSPNAEQRTTNNQFIWTQPARKLFDLDQRVIPGLQNLDRFTGNRAPIAIHLTMFTVEFAKGGICNHHDHAFEEAYLVLEGDVDIVFDGCAYTLRSGDFAWTGVGSRHAFFPVEGRPVRWLEIQAPQPPAQDGNRWHSRWEYLAQLISAQEAAPR